MSKLILAACSVCLALLSGVTVAQSSDANMKPDVPYDLRSQCVSDLENVQEKLIALANAASADKLSWRPSPDSRSLAEVFLHVAGERYVILGLMGVAVPREFEAMIPQKSTSDFEQSAFKDKAHVIDELRKSWDFTRKTLTGMSNTDFSKPLSKPGRQKENGDLVLLLVADQHEHLGQAVAYARENGITPPWTSSGQSR